MTKFFISDTHFGHKGILDFSNRPFETIEEHDRILMQNWNEKVQPSDEVYILGDLTMSRSGKEANKILKSLNGKKYLIKGNHEKYLNDKEFDRKNYVWIKDYFSFKYKHIKFVLFHYPILEWDGYYQASIHCYGHVHNGRTDYFDETLDEAFNVGVDLNNYTPISIDEVIKKVYGLEI